VTTTVNVLIHLRRISHLGPDAVYSGRSLLTFRKSLLHPSSWWKIETASSSEKPVTSTPSRLPEDLNPHIFTYGSFNAPAPQQTLQPKAKRMNTKILHYTGCRGQHWRSKLRTPLSYSPVGKESQRGASQFRSKHRTCPMRKQL
jgi:hypothetical protein